MLIAEGMHLRSGDPWPGSPAAATNSPAARRLLTAGAIVWGWLIAQSPRLIGPRL
jgi:hypothetical protein